MKKICSLLILLYALPSFACDICGAGSGGSYLGIMPSFRKKFIGVRYQYNSLRHHLGPGGSINYLTTTEAYNTVEVWGAVNLGSKFRVTAFVPYNFIKRTNQQENIKDQGIGDITVIGYYQLLNRTNDADVLRHSLWIGAGAKLPSGKYDPEDKNIQQASQNTFQLGTGSVDLSVHAMYDLSYRQTGLNLNIGYKMNTSNKYEYRYGNKFTSNALFYHRLNIAGKVSVAPNAGVMFESAGKDHKTRDIQSWETGGFALLGTAGLETSIGRINVGANFQTPLSQELGEGKLKGRDRVMMHVGLAF
ncbi:transporter [Terrimonas sp. NA20]|uniref:Transporter n=1 Tax=Terrimonas ginsenosidimutans TaxID=2908004 RepID=A0ABS9KXJ9_9BACT|nr:transporter [Terrimonas ginsenosidimutans]MCG2617008.1 transporter [Terrimonas ginsenosidimutans]